MVTDAKGNHIGDVTPEEFEILEDGKRKAISNFSYLSSKKGRRLKALPGTGTRGRERRRHRCLPLRLRRVRRTGRLP